MSSEAVIQLCSDQRYLFLDGSLVFEMWSDLTLFYHSALEVHLPGVSLGNKSHYMWVLGGAGMAGDGYLNLKKL